MNIQGNARGFTLLEVMVSGAIMAIVALLMATMITFLAKSQKTVSQSNDFDNAVQSVNLLLSSSPAACGAAFGGTTVGTGLSLGAPLPMVNTAGLPISVSAITINGAIGATGLVTTAGTPIVSMNGLLSQGMKITGLMLDARLSDNTPTVDSGGVLLRDRQTYELYIEGTPSVSGGAVGVTMKRATLSVSLLSDQTTHNVVECSAAPQSQWRNMTTGINYPSGNVGIGTAAPAFPLDISSSTLPNVMVTGFGAGLVPAYMGRFAQGTQLAPTATQTDDPLSVFGGRGYGATGWGNNTRASIAMRAAQPFTDTAQGAYMTFNTTPNGTVAPAERMRIDQNGNVGIGTGGVAPAYKLDVNGDIRIGGAGTPYRDGGAMMWQITSDARLKDVHGNYELGLNEISKLNTVRFNYKKDNKVSLDTTHEFVGVLAQDAIKLIPDAVHKEKTGYFSLDTTPIFWAMVNAIKELYSQLKVLATRVTELATRVAGLEEKLARAPASAAATPPTADDALQALKAEVQELKSENLALKAWACARKPQPAFCKSPSTASAQ